MGLGPLGLDASDVCTIEDPCSSRVPFIYSWSFSLVKIKMYSAVMLCRFLAV